MSDWLYPITSKAGSWFEDASGTTVDVSYESFRDFIVDGRIKDDEWYLTSNYRRASAGDRMWVYTGDHDLGVIGVGTILAVHEGSPPLDPDGWYVKWRIDKHRSRSLCRHPFPAARIKAVLPDQKRAVMELGSHSSLVADLDDWVEHCDERADHLLKPYSLKKRQIVTRGSGRPVTVDLRHDEILKPIDTLLRSNGFTVAHIDTKPVTADLVGIKLGSKVPTMIIVEAKTIPPRRTGREEARMAYGQVQEYAWRLRRSPAGTHSRQHLWAAFERRPDDDVIAFLEDEGLMVSWGIAGDGPHFSHASAPMRNKLLRS